MYFIIESDINRITTSLKVKTDIITSNIMYSSKLDVKHNNPLNPQLGQFLFNVC